MKPPSMPAKPMRIAVLCSSDGGVLDALCRVQRGGQWPFEIVGVITDRACGAEDVARTHDVPCQRVDSSPAGSWSARAAQVLQRWSPDAILLLILRKVDPEIWRDLHCSTWNLHPSLLPAYPGLNALERNYADAQAAANCNEEVRMGATIHVVTDELDAGPIISQRYFTIDAVPTLQHAQHLCYLYKVALVLECICKFIDNTLPTWQDADEARPWHARYAMWRPYESITDVQVRLAQPWAAKWLEQQVHVNAAKMVSRMLHA